MISDSSRMEISLQKIGFSLERARRIQRDLSRRVILEDRFPTPIRYVAGVDVAYAKGYSIGAVAVLDYDSMKTIDLKISRVKTRFPYIPTLLSFREIPPAVSAIRKLDVMPDITLVDGQGIAHPYRLGFASHLGVVLDIATVGVAKSLLCGEMIHQLEKDLWKPILYDGEIIGAAVSTRRGSKPIYVSVGHKVNLETAVRVVLGCSIGYRIPEPLRAAHVAAEKTKREMMDEMK